VPLTFEWLTMVVIPAVAILLVIFVVWHHRLQQRQINQLAERIVGLTSLQPNQSAEIDELRSGVIGVGQRILQLEQALQTIELNQQALATELEQLTEHQQTIQLFDPDSRLYSRAVKMVQLGAGLEEVMRECELPRAEAELLINLHRQQSS
jgi:chromosome segregation ATPase